MKTSTAVAAAQARLSAVFAGLIFTLQICLLSASAEDEPATREEGLRQQREAKSKSLKLYKPGSIESGALYIQKGRLLERLAEGWRGFHPKLGGLSTAPGCGRHPLCAPYRSWPGRSSRPDSSATLTRSYLTETLIKRRDKVGKFW